MSSQIMDSKIADLKIADSKIMDSKITAPKNPALSRRALLAGAAPVLGLTALSSAPLAFARDKAKKKDQSSALEQKVLSNEYWAKKGDLSLYIYRKRIGAPQTAEMPRPALFLAHGSSVSARPSFDLTVPGHGDYSLMDKFAEYGFDVWTMDFEGYGRSGVGPGNSDIASGAEDIKLASEIILRETGQARFHLCGESSGALRAGLFANLHPERVNRLVLVSFTYTGQGSPTLLKRSESAGFYKTHNRRSRD